MHEYWWILRVQYDILRGTIFLRVQYDVLWSPEKQYWPRPKHIMLHKMKCCNCFITFSIPSFLCVPGSIFRDCLVVFFQIQKHMTWSITYHKYLYKFILLIQCVHIYITNSMCTNLYLHSACVCKTSVPLSVCVCVTSLQRS